MLNEKAELLENSTWSREGPLLVLSKKRIKEGYFFLFPTFLLYTSPKDRHYQQLKLKHIVLLDKAVIRDARSLPEASGYPDAFEIIDSKKKKHILSASSYLDKLMWMHDLESCCT